MTQGNRGSSRTDERLEDEYFEWMVAKAGGWNQRSLLAILHSIPFEWTVYNDGNREDDGAYQRWVFHEETGLPVPGEPSRGSGCSVLEMMLSMADAMHELMYEPDNGSCTQIWMQTFLYNMGIGYLDDVAFEREPDRCCRETEDAVGRLLERRYSRDGVGGMFPLPGERTDVRKMELWYQMNAYCDRILKGYLDGFEAAE